MSSVRRFESDTLQYFWDRYVGDDPERISEYEQCGADIEVAQLIYDMRTEAGLRVERPPESDGWQAKAPASQRAGARTLWGRRFRLPIIGFS